MELNVIGLIVICLLLITLGIQIQVRKMNKKMDELLNRKS
jgi:uncharacterized membrane protein